MIVAGASAMSEFDDLEEILNTPVSATPRPEPTIKIPEAFVEPCPKCGGSGRFYSWSGRLVGPCHHCKGTGKLTFKQPREKRAAARSKIAERKVQKLQKDVAEFQTTHAVVWAWMKESTFPFAVSMREAVLKYGHLTDNQLAASERCVAKLEAAKAAAKARVENAQPINTVNVEAAFAKASKALKSPRLRLAGLNISPAKAESKNAGALYIKADGGVYLGKIAGGKFVPSRDCTPELEIKVRDVCENPLNAAVQYGRLTGQCACCGRELTKGESIERGIGPICAGKFGW